MKFENKSEKGFVLLWAEPNDNIEAKYAETFKLLKANKILPVVIESGSGNLEESIYGLMKQNAKIPLEKSA